MTEQQTTTESIPLSSLSLDQLVRLSQGLGRKADAIREQRAHLKRLIDARLAAGERDGDAQRAAAGGSDAAAQGVVIEARAT